MSSSYRITLDNWLKDLEVSGQRLLDIGGAQERVDKRIRRCEVDEYVIMDLPNPHKDSPAPDIAWDLNQRLGMSEAFGLQSDIIFCLEVFEYIWDPATAMLNISNMLKPDGIAYVTFCSVYPLHQPVADDALRYMPGGIIKLADYAGMKIEKITPRRFETSAWAQTISAERLRAAKGEDHNFSGWIVEFTK